MSNLGPYQEITTAAGKVGGIDRYLEIIQKTAVQRAAPSMYATGLGVGAAIGVGATLGVKRWLDLRQADQEAAEEAKMQLASEIEVLAGAAGDDTSQPDGDGGMN
jgi:hypothetical protein